MEILYIIGIVLLVVGAFVALSLHDSTKKES